MTKLNLVFLTYWMPGHLLSMVEVVKRLLHLSGGRFSVTCLLVNPPNLDHTSSIPSVKSAAASAGLDIHFQDLPPVHPPVEFDGPEHFVFQYLESYKPHVKAAIADLSTFSAVAGLVVDMFASTMIDVADELSVPFYVYLTSNALYLSLLLHLPEIHEKIPVDLEASTQEEIIQLTEICNVPTQSIPVSFTKNKPRTFDQFLWCSRRLSDAKGIIINTFLEIEPRPLKALKAQQYSPSIYPVGPIISLGSNAGTQEQQLQHECIKWLDEQPSATVIFLCFGSMGCFDEPQVREIAIALESTGDRFLWCLRKPEYFGSIQISVDSNPEEVLPEGFLERTRGRGLVWPTLVPQKEILAHQAVAAFVTHCGWNSILESLWFGKPMIGWPLFAEQHLNAMEMAGDVGVVVELLVDRKAGNFVSAEELEKGLRRVMGSCEEGKRVRDRAQIMRKASREALERDGTSNAGLESFIEEICGVSHKNIIK